MECGQAQRLWVTVAPTHWDGKGALGWEFSFLLTGSFFLLKTLTIFVLIWTWFGNWINISRLKVITSICSLLKCPCFAPWRHLFLTHYCSVLVYPRADTSSLHELGSESLASCHTGLVFAVQRSSSWQGYSLFKGQDLAALAFHGSLLGSGHHYSLQICLYLFICLNSLSFRDLCSYRRTSLT